MTEKKMPDDDEMSIKRRNSSIAIKTMINYEKNNQYRKKLSWLEKYSKIINLKSSTTRVFLLALLTLGAIALLLLWADITLYSTHTYEIKEKFQTISPCGFSSSTDYNILTTSEDVITLASGCADVGASMKYYHVWNYIEPGDTITITKNYRGIILNASLANRKIYLR